MLMNDHGKGEFLPLVFSLLRGKEILEKIM